MNNERLFEAIGEINESYIVGAHAPATKSKKAVWMKWGVAAACLCLCVLGLSGVFGGHIDTVTLTDGQKIVFAKSKAVGGDFSLAFPVTSVPLTEEQAAALGSGLSVTAHAVFQDSDAGVPSVPIGIEGHIGKVKAVIALSDVPLLDTVIVGTEETSQVDGVNITAGYLLTKPNSRGEQNAIYYATFTLGNYTVYLENAGAKEERETAKNQLAEVLQKLIENGEEAFTSILDDQAGM